VTQKRLYGKNWYFGPKTSSEHTTKWAPLGPLNPSIPRSTRRVRAHIPIEQPTTVTLSVWGCLGGRSARGVQGSSAKGRPIRFVPSLLKFEHVHAKLTMTPDAPPGAAVMEAWQQINFCLLYHALGTKRMGRPFADDPCTPRAERPPRQPHTLNVTVVGCSMGIWARTLRVDRGMDGFRGPSGAHFVVCSLLVLGPKYQILPYRRFCVTETPEKRHAWMRNG
jgi:hypothetical protein